MDRLRISLKLKPAVTVNRIAIGNEKLVYVICANKMISYNTGRSPIAYIGTTQNGIDRVAQSAAYRSPNILSRHGIDSFDVRIVTCGSRQRIKSWRKLERALLICFKEKFGCPPACNTVGKNFVESDEFDYFARSRVDEVLDNLTSSGQADTAIIFN